MAVEYGAVDKMLIVDSLFRAKDAETRAIYVALVEEVRAQTGKRNSVTVVSSQQSVGEKLTLLSGVACILKYPVPEL